jgi:hypothetical protein
MWPSCAAEVIDGTRMVSTMTSAATSPNTGPMATTLPSASLLMSRAATSAPITIPTPKAASARPTRVAERPRR